MTVAANGVTSVGRADDVPGFCMGFVKAVEAQPRFDGTGSRFKNCKVLPIEDLDNIMLCKRVNERSAQILGARDEWPIYGFHPMLFPQSDSMTCLWDRQKNPIEQGILLAELEGLVPCSYDTLEESYKQVIKEIQTGWKVLKPEDYPKDIYEGHDAEQLNILVQSPSFTYTSELIAIIAKKCGVTIHTYHIFRPYVGSEDLGGHAPTESYIQIEKEKLNDVIAKMGFQL